MQNQVRSAFLVGIFKKYPIYILKNNFKKKKHTHNFWNKTEFSRNKPDNKNSESTSSFLSFF